MSFHVFPHLASRVSEHSAQSKMRLNLFWQSHVIVRKLRANGHSTDHVSTEEWSLIAACQKAFQKARHVRRIPLFGWLLTHLQKMSSVKGLFEIFNCVWTILANAPKKGPWSGVFVDAKRLHLTAVLALHGCDAHFAPPKHKASEKKRFPTSIAKQWQNHVKKVTNTKPVDNL